MAIIINELEVTDSRAETPNNEAQAHPITARSELIDPVDLAQRLALLEERQLRVEAN